MTRRQAIRKREKLASQVCSPTGVLRGSLLRRTIHHSSGCLKCARGEGHPLWVLTVGYPGGKTRQVSLRPAQVRKALEHYRDFKQTLEAISELNQFLLRLDREESKDQEREPRSPPAA
jgi:hypothetical protein